MNKVIVICGPTTSGKTSLSINLAKYFDGEIICADSRTIYEGMNIGTAKPYIDKPYKLLKYDKNFGPIYKIDGVIHYCLDISDPAYRYSVAEFQKLVYKIIKDIIKRGKIPFIVGGTGLYIDAIAKGYKFPKYNRKIREKISKMTDQEIINQLQKFDPDTLKKYKNNRRRLERALEVYLAENRPISAYKKRKPPYKFLFLAIDWSRKELYQRIDEWVDKRIEMGMIDEVKKLYQRGIDYPRLEEFGLEYRHISKYIKNPTPKNFKFQISNLKFKTHAFARRQLTWFYRNKSIHWLKSGKNLHKVAGKLTGNFLK